eukprot:TRINITY_DN724_c0_g1_i3.p2 TRINITY_DN724_c0_g1~~TRINITY_DN724_c0_g1_i3.p2  ORF type:complete len:276 (-),score=91.47 TRINITY_DN724_c0_g1_i3:194-1021(-)
MKKFASHMGRDVGISMASQGVSEVFRNIPLISRGAGTIVLSTIDAVIASRTGDWSRFGLNLVLNVSSAAAGIAGAGGGAMIGAFVGPIGIAVGGAVGGVGGAIVGRLFGASIGFGGPTKMELENAAKAVIAQIDQDLEPLGLRMVPCTWAELQQQLAAEKLNVGLIEGVSATEHAQPSIDTLKLLMTGDQLNTLLHTAHELNAESRLEGLRRIRDAVVAGVGAARTPPPSDEAVHAEEQPSPSEEVAQADEQPASPSDEVVQVDQPTPQGPGSGQ